MVNREIKKPKKTKRENNVLRLGSKGGGGGVGGGGGGVGSAWVESGWGVAAGVGWDGVTGGRGGGACLGSWDMILGTTSAGVLCCVVFSPKKKKRKRNMGLVSFN